MEGCFYLPAFNDFSASMGAGDAISKLNGAFELHNHYDMGNGAQKLATTSLSGMIAGSNISGAVASSTTATNADNGCPIGTVIAHAANTPPTGWLECNGAVISRTTYANLFSIIGTVWGSGDGSTTFNLPDFRGEFLRGWDNGRGIDFGRTFANFQDHQSLNHDHKIRNYNGGIGTNSYPNNITYSSGSYIDSFNEVTESPSGNFGSETRPRNKAILYCIKY